MQSETEKILNLLMVKEKRYITGQNLKDMFLKAHELFTEYFETINSINVFPVPDGDTGINMLETLRAIKKELQENPNSDHCGSVIRKVAYGAFNGSVGNSGLIFSEYLHGLELYWQKCKILTGKDIIRGFKVASDYAYKSLDNPREGTVLTVQRKVAEYLGKTLNNNFINNPYVILLQAFDEAKQALVETHYTLTEVNKAKTIDAGAFAFVLILESFISAVFDETIFFLVTSRTVTDTLLPFLQVTIEDAILEEKAWEIQFTIEAGRNSINKIRDSLKQEGDCLIITTDQDDSHYKIHIHIKKPVNEFLEKLRILFGKIKTVQILDLKKQNENYINVLTQD